MSAAKRPASSSPEGTRAEEAFAKIRKEIEALSDAELTHINIDITAAIATVYGALPAIRSLRQQMEGVTAGGFDGKRIDKLETYARALFHAHTEYVTETSPTQVLPELVEAAITMRDTLYSDALALVSRGLISDEPLRGVKTSPGYKSLALDLSSVASVMRASWDRIEGKTAVQASELEHAAELAEQILSAVGQRELAPAMAAVSAASRQRAFALFLRAYDEARRMVTFLRWREGDVDKIAPSLYVRRQGSGRRKGGDEPESVPSGDPRTPEAAPQPGPVSGVPPVTTAPTVPLGLPGSDPFAAE